MPDTTIPLGIPLLLANSGLPAKPSSPERMHDAGQQFEALLIAQMLRTARESGSGWLGTGEDQAGECAIGMAEEQLGEMLARAGGLGLSSLIEEGLQRKG